MKYWYGEVRDDIYGKLIMCYVYIEMVWKKFFISIVMFFIFKFFIFKIKSVRIFDLNNFIDLEIIKIVLY